MSCFDAGTSKVAKAKVLEFAASHNFALNAVSAYLGNSDFSIRNVHVRENTFIIVFEKNPSNGRCLILDIISIDQSLVIIDITKTDKNDYMHVIHRVR